MEVEGRPMGYGSWNPSPTLLETEDHSFWKEKMQKVERALQKSAVCGCRDLFFYLSNWPHQPLDSRTGPLPVFINRR